MEIRGALCPYQHQVEALSDLKFILWLPFPQWLEWNEAITLFDLHMPQNFPLRLETVQLISACWFWVGFVSTHWVDPCCSSDPSRLGTTEVDEYSKSDADGFKAEIICSCSMKGVWANSIFVQLYFSNSAMHSKHGVLGPVPNETPQMAEYRHLNNKD